MENERLYPVTTKELADKKAALAPKNLEAWRNFSKTVFEEGALYVLYHPIILTYFGW